MSDIIKTKIKKQNKKLKIENQKLKRELEELEENKEIKELKEKLEDAAELCSLDIAAEERWFLNHNRQQCEFTGEIAPDYEWRIIFSDGWSLIKDLCFKQISDNKYKAEKLTEQQYDDILVLTRT